jgi:hypothetical protein
LRGYSDYSVQACPEPYGSGLVSDKKVSKKEKATFSQEKKYKKTEVFVIKNLP